MSRDSLKVVTGPEPETPVNSGGDGGGGGMESRLSAIESRLSAVETRIEYLATKEDIQKMQNDTIEKSSAQMKWVVRIALSTIAIVSGIAFFAAKFIK